MDAGSDALTMAPRDPVLVWDQPYRHAVIASQGGLPMNLTGVGRTVVGTPSGATSPGIISIGRKGPTIDWAADATNRGLHIPEAAQPPSIYSMEALIEVGSLPGVNGEPIAGYMNAAGGSWDRTLGLEQSGAVSFYFYSSGGTTLTSASTYAPGDMVHAIAVSKSGVGTTLYVNGAVQATNGTKGGGDTGYASPRFILGYQRARNSTIVRPGHKLYFATVINRELSLAEIKARCADPFRAFSGRKTSLMVGTIASGAQSETFAGIAPTSSVGAPTSSITTPLAGIASTSTVGAPTVVQGTSATLSGIAPTATVGAPSAAVAAPLAGIASTSSVGAPSVLGTQSATLAGIASTSTVGAPTISATYTASFSGIASTATVGSPKINYAALMAGIASTATVGSPSVSRSVLMAGIASTATVGSPTVRGFRRASHRIKSHWVA